MDLVKDLPRALIHSILHYRAIHLRALMSIIQSSSPLNKDLGAGRSRASRPGSAGGLGQVTS
jgi:hypothetical protein